MQQALQYRTWIPPSSTQNAAVSEKKSVHKLVSENALLVFGKRGCCMCYVAKQLLLGLGVNPTVEEIDDKEEEAVIQELSKLSDVFGQSDGKNIVLPAFFVGGKFFGGLERIMGTHISGELVPILREAGALWL